MKILNVTGIRRLLVAALIGVMVSPQVVLAQAPMDVAIAAVHASHEKAMARALEAVEIDFNFALSEVMKNTLNSASGSDVDKARAKILVDQKTLLEGFSRLAQPRDEKSIGTDVELLRSELERFMSDYQSLVRLRYSASFHASDAREDFRKSISIAREAFASFERSCRTGRGVGGLGVKAFYYPNLPRADYEVNLSMGSDGTSGSGRYVGTGSQAEQDRNTVTNVAATSAGLTASIAVSGQTGAVVAAAQAAAPFMAAGAAVIVLTSMYIGHQERVKAENELVAAKLHAFRKMASDADAGQYYIEQCKERSLAVEVISQALETALHDPTQLRLASERVPDIGAELTSFKMLIDERETAKRALEELKGTDNAEKIEIAKTTLLEKDRLIAEQTKPERVADLVLANLSNQSSVLSRQLGDLNFQAVDMAQKRAYSNLLRLVDLVHRSSFREVLADDGAIQKELRGINSYLSARALFRETLKLQIQEIFGRVTRETVARSEEQLKKAARELSRNYLHIPQVLEFNRQVKSLVGSL
ncbi:MAG: hypothetical protein RBT63_00955 [Bdellovibrionales bacterium]|jgi:hypothetical protein|nr:hypothetical protein [Bdellovibrionales bacterium]